MTEIKNDWRMQLIDELAKDANFPWLDQTAPRGSQVTLCSVIELKRKKHLTIAVPNATALCLSVSMRAWTEAKELRVKSGIDKSLKSQVSFASHEDAFDYIERVMESVVMAFTALEAFVNEIIPDEYEYYVHRKSKIILESMDKKQIERQLSLDEKMSAILPEILKAPSPKGGRSWSKYKKLKKIRDRVIHMKSHDRKSSGPDNVTLWHELFRIEPPYKQAKEIIDYFAKDAQGLPRWYREYPL